MNKAKFDEYESVLSSYQKLDDLITMLDKPSRKNLGLVIAVSSAQSREKDDFLLSLTTPKKNKIDVLGYYKGIAVVSVDSVGLWIYIVPKEAEIYTTIYDTKRKNT